MLAARGRRALQRLKRERREKLQLESIHVPTNAPGTQNCPPAKLLRKQWNRAEAPLRIEIPKDSASPLIDTALPPPPPEARAIHKLLDPPLSKRYAAFASSLWIRNSIAGCRERTLPPYSRRSCALGPWYQSETSKSWNTSTARLLAEGHRRNTSDISTRLSGLAQSHRIASVLPLAARPALDCTTQEWLCQSRSLMPWNSAECNRAATELNFRVARYTSKWTRKAALGALRRRIRAPYQPSIKGGQQCAEYYALWACSA